MTSLWIENEFRQEAITASKELNAKVVEDRSLEIFEAGMQTSCKLSDKQRNQ